MVSNQLYVLLVSIAGMALIQQAALCPISLPQDLAWHPICKILRITKLVGNRRVYGVSQLTPEMPYARLDKNQTEYLGYLLAHPFQAAHAKKWIGQGLAIKLFNITYYMASNVPRKDANQDTMTMNNFATAKEFFRKSISSPVNPFREYMTYPSSSEPFQLAYKQWISDQFFAEQRLAGVNPMTIQKVTFSNTIGMNYNNLTDMLNPNFNLIEAVGKVLSDVTDQSSLEEAISGGYLFVVYHPFNNGIPSMQDLTNSDPNRTMWEYKSPIAIFASTKDNAALTPVAIQMDDALDSAVYTPEDGDNWMLAKLNTQLTDLSWSQIVEHLSKVHFIIEAVCLGIERRLSSKHPLYDIMRFHCRGVFTLNTLGGPVLLYDQQELDYTVEFGNEGANVLTQRAAKVITWNDLDLKNNLNRRGLMDKKRLPYYPYRDDGLVIFDVLEKFVTDYVRAIYFSSYDVKQDHELQNFANEISNKGWIRGFPASFETQNSVIETFTRILWLMVGQHTAVNYPQSDYATYVPNVPTKLYDVNGVPNDEFSPERLEGRLTTSYQLSLVSTLASFRFDRLFDYGPKLGTPQGRIIVNNYKVKLATEVEPKLATKNRERLAQGHLTYPYMQPSWLTNGIQS